MATWLELLVLVGTAAACSRASSPSQDSGSVFSLPDVVQVCRQGSGPAALGDGAADALCGDNTRTVSFNADVLPILGACTGEVCHAPWRYETLVGKHSTICCDHRWLVAPGQPSASHVVQALRGQGACVSQMPLDEGSLSDQSIATVVAWICQGAPDN